ncbi:Nucleolar protein 14 [Paragonimus heterotremus]|uniref:Nucleolar protein 14 n=1 Tax=Paragonimus heterotremus TaxID=100268 RepID=A0A8J4T8I7_9TREM|nr:Nucleolar protein 14 [Paragonimus heterotremus]
MKTSTKLKIKSGNRVVKISRDSILRKKLSKLGKVGGVKDLRLGSKDKHRSDAETSLRRHIVERMRQLDEVAMERDTDDAMNQAAFGPTYKTTMDAASLRLDDKADGGLQADVVDEEFFVSGSDPHKFKDALAEKIAASKLLKLKRVEENEEQRERLKTVNSEWSQKIRFMLSQISLKTPITPKKAVKNRECVSKLLGELNFDKKVPPADLKDNTNTEDKRIQKLQVVLEKNSSAVHAGITQESVTTFETDAKKKKTVGYLLRLLLRMKEHQSHAIVFVTQSLEQAQLRNLKDVIHYLLLIQLLLEHCQPKINRDEMSPVLQSIQATNTGAFSPEIVKLLTRMWCLTTSTDETSTDSKPLILQKNLDELHRSAHDRLNIEWADEDFHFSPEKLSSIQVACLHKLVDLSTQVCRLYSSLFVGCVCVQLFARMYRILLIVDSTKYPDELKTSLRELTDLVTSIWRSPAPKPLVSNARLRILSSEATEMPVDQKVLKKFGLLPQLEPRFEERLCVHNDKNTASKRLLQRKVAREKRGAMREIRRDGQFFAMHQLKLTKASDAARKKKTQAILNSLRTIED